MARWQGGQVVADNEAILLLQLEQSPKWIVSTAGMKAE